MIFFKRYTLQHMFFLSFVGSGEQHTVHAPLLPAFCIFFTPFFIAVCIVERLILQSDYYFMILFYLTFIEQKLEKTTFLLYICTTFPGNFSEPQNPRFIIESGFKSRAGYNGARTVFNLKLIVDSESRFTNNENYCL